MAIHHVEVPCNWRTVKNVLTGNQSLWPTVKEVASARHVAHDVHDSVLVRFHERDDFDMAEVRDWLGDTCQKKFKMFNRFYYRTQQFTIHRSFEGVNFQFAPSAISQAVFFKLAFGGV
jgi:hypothetical protein